MQLEWNDILLHVVQIRTIQSTRCLGDHLQEAQVAQGCQLHHATGKGCGKS